MRTSLLGWAVALACGRPAAVVVEADVSIAPPPPAPIAVEAPASPPAAMPDPWLIVRDPALLAAWQADGLGLAEIAFGRPAGDNAQLGADPHYASIVEILRRDLEATRRADTHAGVGLRHLHRLFDARWLTSDRAWFELVAVVNRIDRRGFAPDRCGETRLVFRLAHRALQGGTMVASRLPMTVNAVFWQPDDGAGCREQAASWRAADPEALRERGGPLSTDRLALAHLKSVEIDVQLERWPSTIRPDLAGHAGYVLRVFERDDARGKMIAQPLENTPDVSRLARDAPQREALLAWLREPTTLAAIDRGVVLTPEPYLATTAVSVTPRGLARLANRPWSSLFDPAAVADLDLSAYATISSPAALLRRLDMLTCNGCHQSRSIAGFHVLGDERDDPDRVDALGVGTSPHLEAELARRRIDAAALAEGRATIALRLPADVDALALQPAVQAGYGGHCGLGDAGFAWMQCATGLACTRIDDDAVGVCLPAEPGAGAPCEIGPVLTHRNPARDRIRKAVAVPCGAGAVCDDNRVGFPAGMCVVSCSDVGVDEACGAIPQLAAFNDCLSTGRRFADCLRTSANAAGMRACDEDRACRDDYICARTGNGSNVCLPPYFLYQLRVDGHPP